MKLKLKGSQTFIKIIAIKSWVTSVRLLYKIFREKIKEDSCRITSIREPYL